MAHSLHGVHHVQDSEGVVDDLVIDYVSSITTDRDSISLSLSKEPKEATSPRSSSRPSRGPKHRSRRRRAADEYVVIRRMVGRWSLLPLGSRVKRPRVKLVQLVAHAIHASPRRLLRVNHIYTALQ